MEAAVACHSLCLLSAFHYNQRKGGVGGRDFPSHSTLHHKYQGQERKPGMFLTVVSATDSRCSLGDESESSNSCVPEEVSLCCIKKFKKVESRTDRRRVKTISFYSFRFCCLFFISQPFSWFLPLLVWFHRLPCVFLPLSWMSSVFIHNNDLIYFILYLSLWGLVNLYFDQFPKLQFSYLYLSNQFWVWCCLKG